MRLYSADPISILGGLQNAMNPQGGRLGENQALALRAQEARHRNIADLTNSPTPDVNAVSQAIHQKGMAQRSADPFLQGLLDAGVDKVKPAPSLLGTSPNPNAPAPEPKLSAMPPEERQRWINNQRRFRG